MIAHHLQIVMKIAIESLSIVHHVSWQLRVRRVQRPSGPVIVVPEVDGEKGFRVTCLKTPVAQGF